jgi:hypothetical protein
MDFVDDRLNKIYTYVFEMAGIYELSACAIAFEGEMQRAYFRLLAKGKDLHPALVLWQKKYDITSDPIKRLARPFCNRLQDEIRDFQKTGNFSPALLVLNQHFPLNSTSTQIFESFNSKLETYLDYAIFQQMRFISLYAQSPKLFVNQRGPLIRSLGLSALLQDRRARKVDRMVDEQKKEGAIPIEFKLDDLREESRRDLSWIKPRDSAFLLNMRKGKWTPEYLKKFGIDINAAFQHVSENLTLRRLPHGTALNYIAFIEMAIDSLSPPLREVAIKNVANVLSRLQFSDQNIAYGIVGSAQKVLSSDALDDVEKIGAYLHLNFMAKSPQALTIEPKSHPLLKSAIKEISPSARLELEAYRIFAIDDGKGKRLSRMKRGSIAEDMGL